MRFFKNNDLLIGKGHYKLNNKKETLKLAGRLKIVDSKIVYIDNDSGHYIPTKQELNDIIAVFKNLDMILPNHRTNIVETYLANNYQSRIIIHINEFNDTQYPQFDVLINGNILGVYKIPTCSEFTSPTFKLEKIEGIDLTNQEEIEIIKIFNSYLMFIHLIIY